MYLDDIAATVRSYIPDERMPKEHAEQLLLIYAVLLRAKGTSVSDSDIHDAWSVWMSTRNRQHDALVTYELLPSKIQKEDSIFTEAVRAAAKELGQIGGDERMFLETLFPSGPPKDSEATKQALELYKMMVGSSEGLVSRRQAVNTFFLTINGALLTACGLIVQSSKGSGVSAWGIFVLALAGAILCSAWRSLIGSFGQLNRGKFKVINSVERYLNVAIYAAEWEALERGENPKVYRSFTSREIWVPNAMLCLHILGAVVALLFATQSYFPAFKNLLWSLVTKQPAP